MVMQFSVHKEPVPISGFNLFRLLSANQKQAWLSRDIPARLYPGRQTRTIHPINQTINLPQFPARIYTYIRVYFVFIGHVCYEIGSWVQINNTTRPLNRVILIGDFSGVYY